MRIFAPSNHFPKKIIPRLESFRMDVDNVPVVSKDEVLDIVKTGEGIILDVLARSSYDMIHIRGSISAPYDKVENGEFDHFDKEKPLIVYCASYSCGASRKAAAIMQERGFNAYAYEGGIREWAESGYPTGGKMTAEDYLANQSH